MSKSIESIMLERRCSYSEAIKWLRVHEIVEGAKKRADDVSKAFYAKRSWADRGNLGGEKSGTIQSDGD